MSVFCGHQARYSCSDNGDGTHLRGQHLHSEQGDTRRSSCENTKRLNTVIATLHTAVRRCRRCRGREALGVGEPSAIKTGEELKEVRALRKVSACRPRLVVAQCMNGRSGHGTTHVDDITNGGVVLFDGNTREITGV